MHTRGVTPAINELEREGVAFSLHEYEHGESLHDFVNQLQESAERVGRVFLRDEKAEGEGGEEGGNGQARQEFERQFISASLKSNGGNLCRSARSLGVHRNTLRNKVSNLGIEVPDRGPQPPAPKT